MISSTLNQYKDSFKANLLAFLNEYEDNTKAFFLQNEKTKYKEYQKALTKIADQMKFFTREELNQNLVHRSIASDLKSIDINIYNSIITELNPIEDKTILSLSAAKKDIIKIDEIALENHIKSSIAILKFISEEFYVPFDLKEKSLSKDIEYILDVTAQDLDTWLKANQNKIDYSTFPMMIEEKADYVIDSYKNYEERNFKHQIAICNSILINNQDEKIIVDYKKKFEKNLTELRKQYPIPSVNIETIISDISNAFFRLENFMKGTISIYQSFLFNDAFTIFFNELNKVENINPKNFSLRDGYHYLLSQIDYAHDKGEFKNQEAYKNDDFNRDCNEICYLHFHRSSEFGLSGDLDDYKFEIPSILDIVADATSQAQKTVVENSQQVVATPKKTIPKLIVSYQNLVNDPIFNSDNEHIVLERELNAKINERLEQNRLNDIFYADNFDDDFEEWQKEQNLAIGESFKQLVKKLNQEKIFFFGCSFDNYKLNYEKRLNAFLENYYDTEESDFIKSEEEFLENVLYDLKNPEGAHDGYSVSGFDNFSKAYEIVMKLGFDQYLFSDNKKTAFLQERKAKLFPVETALAKPILEDENIIEDGSVTINNEEPNNFLESTIHEYLDEFKTEINGNGYEILVNALFQYFSNGNFPQLQTKINFKRINKKRVGWALKDLYKSEKTNNLEIEYFRFAKDNINLFADEIIIEEGFKKSKFYKMFTTNPTK